MFDGREAVKLRRRVTEHQLRSLWVFLKTLPATRSQRMWSLLAIFVPFIWVNLVILRLQFGRMAWVAPVSVLLSVIVTLLFSRYFDSVSKRAFLDVNLAELGEQEFWLDEDGFGNGTPAGSAFHKWHTILRLDEPPGWMVVSCRGHVYSIPVETTDTEAQAFAREVRSRWQSRQPR